jgi:hypothetical protein
MTDQLEPHEVLVRLLTAKYALSDIHGRAGNLGADAALACGEALGCVLRAIAAIEKLQG